MLIGALIGIEMSDEPVLLSKREKKKASWPGPGLLPTAQQNPGFPSGRQSSRCLLRLRRLCQAQPTRRGGRHFSHGCGLDMGVPGVGEVDREARRVFRSAVPFLPLPLRSSFCYPVWTNPHRLAVAGMPVKAALLLNYDPTGPSRLLPIV